MGNMELLTTLLLLIGFGLSDVHAEYRIGAGIADCTGPAAEVIFMGYAKLSQWGAGIHLRQFARAFIIDDGTNRIAFVSVDVGMIGFGMREAIIKNLSERYGNTYSIQNLIISGTHSHSTPGGFLKHMLFDATTLGHVKQTFDALVAGITKALINAHENMVEGRIYLKSGILLNANINRSPASYLLNPEEERAQYEYNVDKEMVQLKFVASSDNEPIGVINWFPVHPVSMNNTNLLISSDNVGYASLLLERFLNNNPFPGEGKVVTAFASTNLGDVSPNLNGPICIDTGLPCDEIHSTCDGQAQYCIASGPGKDMYESTKIIAERLYGKALELYSDGNGREITGQVNVIHQYIDMPTAEVEYTWHNGSTEIVRGCNSAMGYSFAAGTTDGPGEFDFKQGTTTNNFLWDFAAGLLAPPSKEDIRCHAPKPILLATGQMVDPYEWQPRVVSTQLATIGDVAIVAVPVELTTMSGRRIKNVVKRAIVDNGGSDDTKVIIAGLCNNYVDYVATYEEYQLQRYEGASTVHGPHTLAIYMAQYKKLAAALTKGETLDEGPPPYSFEDKKLFTLIAPVILDMPDLDNKYGTCTLQPPATVTVGDTVTVKFVSGHPRNDLRQGGTFLVVERLEGDDWIVIANDAFWETRFRYARTYLIAAEVTIEWDVDINVAPGTYRIRHFGYSKSLFGRTAPYEGSSKEFQVVQA